MLILEARDADQIGLGGGVVVITVRRRHDAVPSKLRGLLRTNARNDSDSTHCCERFKLSYLRAVLVEVECLQYSWFG